MLAVDYARLEKMVILHDVPKMEALYKAIGCEYVEIVRCKNLPEGYRLVIDEEGKLKGSTLNVLGSYLYGTPEHGDTIVGNAVIMKETEGPEGADLEWLTKDEADFIEGLMEKLWRPAVRAMNNYYDRLNGENVPEVTKTPEIPYDCT